MALMLPPPGSASAECDIEGKMACMSVNGYSYCARKNVDLDEVRLLSPLLTLNMKFH